MKQRIVFAYLNGEGTFEELADKYGLRNSAQAKVWVDIYSEDKSLTASPSKKQVPTMRKKTTFEERIEVVEYVTKHKHSYAEAADNFRFRISRHVLGYLRLKMALMKRSSITVAIIKTNQN